MIYLSFKVLPALVSTLFILNFNNISAQTNTPDINDVINDKIVLDKNEIINLGITFTGNKLNAVIECYYKINNRTSEDFVDLLEKKGYNSKSGIYRTNVSIDPVSILPDEEPIQYGGWNQNKGTLLYPVAITVEFSKNSTTGNNSNLSTMYVAGNSPALREFANQKVFKWDNKKFIPQINKLLPVTFALESGDVNKTSLRIHFWYYPTKELIEKLPEKYRESLKKELGIVDDINSGNQAAIAGCEKMEGKDSYFDICESSSGALGGISVFPHPVVTNAKCRLYLKESRVVSVFLYDGGGALMGNVVANQSQTAGNNDFDLPFEELNSGVYILVAITEKNEKITTKIIVNK
jgi:hypothetical protein